LDFTVVGRAVNEASRLEKLCGELGEHLLLSQSFTSASDFPCDHLGLFALRGVSERVNVFRVSHSENL
jgi:adenylate cyclase